MLWTLIGAAAWLSLEVPSTTAEAPRGVQHLHAADSPQPYDRKVAVLVGIDTYASAVGRLEYATTDVEAIHRLLIELLGFDEVVPLINDEATRPGILRKVAQLTRELGPNDQFLFFFAGHGLTVGGSEDGLGYLLPYDVSSLDEEAVIAHGLSMADLRTHLVRLPAKHVLVLIDSCVSGFFAVNRRGQGSSSPEESRRFFERKARQLITAGRRDESSLENGLWGHSALTLALLSGLSTGEADKNSDAMVTAEELHLHISDLVARVTGGRQSPQFGNLTEDEGEFAFLLSGEVPARQRQSGRALRTLLVLREDAKVFVTSAGVRQRLSSFPRFCWRVGEERNRRVPVSTSRDGGIAGWVEFDGFAEVPLAAVAELLQIAAEIFRSSAGD